MSERKVGDVETVGRCYCGGTVTRRFVKAVPTLTGTPALVAETTCDRGGLEHADASAAYNRAFADLLMTRDPAVIPALRHAATFCAQVGLSEFAGILGAESVEGHIARGGEVLRRLGTPAVQDRVVFGA